MPRSHQREREREISSKDMEPKDKRRRGGREGVGGTIAPSSNVFRKAEELACLQAFPPVVSEIVCGHEKLVEGSH